MTQNPAILRSLLIYAIVLPLALFLGYMLATPLDRTSFFTVGLVLLLLIAPLLLKWHHPLTIFAWNTTAVVFFLPGRPSVWLLLGIASFAITLGQRALNRRMRLAPAPSALWSLLFIGIVVLITARLTGGIGLGALGGETQGGRRYIQILVAIMGFIAISSHFIPRDKANLYVGLFFLSAVTAAIGSTIALLKDHPSLYFIYWVFPVDTMSVLADDPMAGTERVGRSWGLTVACAGVCYYILARWGLRELLERRRIRLFLLLAVAAIGTLGGFRSYLILVGLVFLIVFLIEGLHRSRYMGLVLMAGILFAIAAVAQPARLPLSIQRTISFLPLEVSPAARWSAESSSHWRVQIWRDLLPEVPRYFWLGKGLSIKTAEFRATLDTSYQGAKSAEIATMAGDYHNGPLSVIIPFGIWGVIGLLWFLWAGFRVLYLNFRYGDPELRRINQFLLAYFVTRMVLFFAVFGGFYSDLAIFAGVVALSVALNHGVARQTVPVTEPVTVPDSMALSSQPAIARLAR